MTVTKDQIRNRITYWNDHPPAGGYNQGRYTPGPDGKSYRDDCSGYVSMLTGMTASPYTGLMVDTSYSTAISKADLTFGDIIIAPPVDARGGHVVLFDRWVNDARTVYRGHEFGWGLQPIHRDIAYPYDANDSRDFKPRRLTAVIQAATPKPTPGPAPKPTPPKPGGHRKFPLPTGYYFGPLSGPLQSISGMWAGEGTQLGAHRAGIALVQTAINTAIRRAKKAGDDHVPAELIVDGQYATQTINAVKWFQRTHNLTADGRTGPATWTALGL